MRNNFLISFNIFPWITHGRGQKRESFTHFFFILKMCQCVCEWVVARVHGVRVWMLCAWMCWSAHECACASGCRLLVVSEWIHSWQAPYIYNGKILLRVLRGLFSDYDYTHFCDGSTKPKRMPTHTNTNTHTHTITQIRHIPWMLYTRTLAHIEHSLQRFLWILCMEQMR